MSHCRAALERAILAKAMSEPEFMQQLLQDPQGCLRGLAQGKLPAGMSMASLWALRDLPAQDRSKSAH